MGKPVVAIIGKPNVGKSTFFNYLTGQRIAIVEDTPGVTRDRIYSDVSWRDLDFTIIDTGGIETDSNDQIKQQMLFQAKIAINSADLIVFLVDKKTGITPQDKEISEMLRKSDKDIILAVNKHDQIGEINPEVYEFYNLGLGEFCVISSAQGLGMGDLLDEIYNKLIHLKDDSKDDSFTHVAIVGKPNVGKSTLVNTILGEERVIVSNEPGTTRDAIDIKIKVSDKEYIFIDTAGMRKKSKIDERIEKFSILRGVFAIERADVVLLLIDATQGITEQDTKIAGLVHEAGKAIIIIVNKWDLVQKETKTLERYKEHVASKLAYMPYAPILFISCKTKQRVNRIKSLIDYVEEQASIRIPTGMLNDVLNEAIQVVQPPTDKGKRLKIYYMTQISIKPPTFLLFINKKDLFHFSYERYIKNQLRKNFGFEGSKIVLISREKGEKK